MACTHPVTIIVPWNNWYHCSGSTYGTWLPGDQRGWRARDHRYHVDGDYKRPPVDSEWRRSLHTHSAQQLKQPPVHLATDQAKRIACAAFKRQFEHDNIPCAAIAVADSHFHVLIQVRDARPGTWLGRARKYATHTLKRAGAVDGRVWATAAQCKPVVDRSHFVRAVRYVASHAATGRAAAWVNEEYAL